MHSRLKSNNLDAENRKVLEKLDVSVRDHGVQAQPSSRDSGELTRLLHCKFNELGGFKFITEFQPLHFHFQDSSEMLHCSL